MTSETKEDPNAPRETAHPAAIQAAGAALQTNEDLKRMATASPPVVEAEKGNSVVVERPSATHNEIRQVHPPSKENHTKEPTKATRRA